MKSKYDWQALKLEFFQSDIDEVYNFLAGKFGENTVKWNLKNKVKWWSKEKQEYKNRILEKALEKQAEEQAKELEIPIETLKKAKKKAIIKIINYLNKQLNPSEMEKVIRMIKTELGEPTTISKNDTTVRWEPLDESLFIQN